MQGTVIRSYKTDSIIYFEGDRGDNIYILQKGAIRLIYSSLDGQEEIREDVKKGEFFGVKSSLGHYPREETAQVLADSSVLVFDVGGFHDLCLNNVRLVLQILKVFSSQLRRVHKQVREQLGEIDSLENSIEFLRVGEYYYKHGHIDKSKYIFERFMKDHPDSDVYNRAVTLKRLLDSGQTYPEDIEPIGGGDRGSKGPNDDDENLLNQKNHANSNNSAISNNNKAGANGVSALFYESLNLINNDLDLAIQKFQEVMQTKGLTSFQDILIVENTHFELNKCYLKKSNFDKAIQSTSDFIRKYPNNRQVKKALITLAEAFEGKNNIQKAMTFYIKVSNLPPKDQDSSLATKRLNKLKEKINP